MPKSVDFEWPPIEPIWNYATSPYLGYKRSGYPHYPFHPGDMTWRERIFMRLHNQYDFNVDYHECGYYDPEHRLLLTPIRPKYIAWPHRMRWYYPEYEEDYFKTFMGYVMDEEEWIVCEPYMVADKCGRWIEVGNSMHKTAAWGAIFSMLICFHWPNKKWAYWPFTWASVFGMIGYFIYMKDPINKYQVEWNKRELSRFPMKMFFTTPFVFRKVPNLGRRVCHRILSISCFAYTLYYLPWYPPCGCAYEADIIPEVLAPGFWHSWREFIE